MCHPKHVEQLRNIGIINSTTQLHLVGSFYEIYITMHGSMNIKFMLSSSDSDIQYKNQFNSSNQIGNKFYDLE